MVRSRLYARLASICFRIVAPSLVMTTSPPADEICGEGERCVKPAVSGGEACGGVGRHLVHATRAERRAHGVGDRLGRHDVALAHAAARQRAQPPAAVLLRLQPPWRRRGRAGAGTACARAQRTPSPERDR